VVINALATLLHQKHDVLAHGVPATPVSRTGCSIGDAAGYQAAAPNHQAMKVPSHSASSPGDKLLGSLNVAQ
jgi:hypothetical protein